MGLFETYAGDPVKAVLAAFHEDCTIRANALEIWANPTEWCNPTMIPVSREEVPKDWFVHSRHVLG
jgi:hypothetical protein